jgi:hypothetical protein
MIVDVDGDQFTTSENLGIAANFITKSSTGLKISPTNGDESGTPYTIKIKLTDKNAAPKSNIYTISILVPLLNNSQIT